MSTPPEGNEALQLEWSTSRSDRTQKRQRDTIDQAAKLMRKHAPKESWDRVLVVGPQHGYELQHWKKHVDVVVGLDPVPEFVADCTKLGCWCVQGYAERADEVFKAGDRWNVYSSHSLEHCYDRALAIEKLKQILDYWMYLAVPIEPGSEPVRDKAHLCPVRSIDDLQSELAPLTKAWEFINPSSRKREKVDYRCFMVRSSNDV